MIGTIAALSLVVRVPNNYDVGHVEEARSATVL